MAFHDRAPEKERRGSLSLETMFESNLDIRSGEKKRAKFSNVISQTITFKHTLPSKAIGYKLKATTSINNQYSGEKIKLKSVNLTDDDGLRFEIHVKNICFEKNVYVVYSTDGWQTVQRSKAMFELSYLDDDCDIFSVEVDCSRFTETKFTTMSFCLKFSAGETDHWDNNFGQNYSVGIVRHEFGIVKNENFVKIMPGRPIAFKCTPNFGIPASSHYFSIEESMLSPLSSPQFLDVY